MKKALSLVLSAVMVLSLCSAFVLAVSADGATNLAAGKSYTYPTDSVYSNGWSGVGSMTATCLTDGAKQHNKYYDAEYTGWMNPGDTLEIVVDLGAVYSVSSVNAYAYGGGLDGVAAPTDLAVAVSTDGSTWTDVSGTLTDTTTNVVDNWNNPGVLSNLCVVLDAAANAQYVKFIFTPDGHFVMLDELEVYGTEAVAEAKTLGIDIVNTYDWTETDFGGDLGKTAVSAGHVVLAVSDVEASVADKIGGAWFTWWYKVLAEWDASAEAYVVTATDVPSSAEYESWVLGEGKIAFMCNLSYSSSEVAGNADDATVLTGIVVGDKITINGSDWATLAASSGALEGVTFGINAPKSNTTVVISKGDNVALNKTYALSGCGERTAYYAKLTDGVAKDVLSYNSEEWFGFYCNGEDETVINAPDKVGYAVIDLGESTDLYSVRVNLVNNLGAGIGEPESVKVYLSDDGETFTEAGTLETVADENTAYWSEVNVEGSARYVKVEIKLNAEKSFAFINEIEVYEAVKTVVENDPVVKEEADTSMMGTAPEKYSFKATVSAPDSWKAGEKIDVKITVEALEDISLAQVIFNLYYDANDVAPVLPAEEELGTLVTTGADSWKDTSIFYLGEAVDAYGCLVCAPATTEEADVLNAGDSIEITVTFEVLDTASGLINFQLSNDGLVGYTYGTPAVASEAGLGSSVAVANEDNLGDAGIYVIAALALVALIGTAVVIKKRA